MASRRPPRKLPPTGIKIDLTRVDAALAGVGEGIFFTWNADTTNQYIVDEAKHTVRQLLAGGTTIRGCSYDRRVVKDTCCPVCHNLGTMDVAPRVIKLVK